MQGKMELDWPTDNPTATYTLILLPGLICSFPNINLQGVTEQSPEFKEPLLTRSSLQNQEPQTLEPAVLKLF